ncbi:MAG: addiction module protein [Verrucomicrobiota bacterium]
MEALWDALCHEGEEPTSPDWHENILKDRSSKIASGQATFLSLVEAKKRIEG